MRTSPSPPCSTAPLSSWPPNETGPPAGAENESVGSEPGTTPPAPGWRATAPIAIVPTSNAAAATTDLAYWRPIFTFMSIPPFKPVSEPVDAMCSVYRRAARAVAKGL
jgi:hypothetical protein